MENRLRGDKANKDIPSVCGDTSAENIFKGEKQKKYGRENKLQPSFLSVCLWSRRRGRR